MTSSYPKKICGYLSAASPQSSMNFHNLAADDENNELVETLRGHLGVDPRGLPVVTHEFPG